MTRWMLLAALALVAACGDAVAPPQVPRDTAQAAAQPMPGQVARPPPPGQPTGVGLPRPIDDAARGADVYQAFCGPCHGRGGDNGPMAGRMVPRPPPFAAPRLRAASDGHFLTVIENGYGAMYPYGDRVAPDDRLRIVAHIRRLQAPAAGAP